MAHGGSQNLLEQSQHHTPWAIKKFFSFSMKTSLIHTVAFFNNYASFLLQMTVTSDNNPNIETIGKMFFSYYSVVVENCYKQREIIICGDFKNVFITHNSTE